MHLELRSTRELWARTVMTLAKRTPCLTVTAPRQMQVTPLSRERPRRFPEIKRDFQASKVCAGTTSLTWSRMTPRSKKSRPLTKIIRCTRGSKPRGSSWIRSTSMLRTWWRSVRRKQMKREGRPTSTTKKSRNYSICSLRSEKLYKKWPRSRRRHVKRATYRI